MHGRTSAKRSCKPKSFLWVPDLAWSARKRALERTDVFLEETDDHGRMGKVAAVAVVGNKDGAHHVSVELFQALNSVGITIGEGRIRTGKRALSVLAAQLRRVIINLDLLRDPRADHWIAFNVFLIF